MPATPAPFSVTTIGAAVNRLPNLYSRVGELGGEGGLVHGVRRQRALAVDLVAQVAFRILCLECEVSTLLFSLADLRLL